MNWIIVFQGIFVVGCFFAIGVCINFTKLKYDRAELPVSVYQRLIYKRKQYQKIEDPMQEAMLHQKWLKEVQALKLKDRHLREV